MMSKITGIHTGFIPLVDCAPLVIAKEHGFDASEGIELHLHREVSWANIRDKVNVGIYDCAHMLAPMPLAASCGIGHVRENIIAPMNLSLNGNAITVSNALFDEMMNLDPQNAVAGSKSAAKAIARVAHERNERGEDPLMFGIVYPFSCHNFELRNWLAEAGLHPDKDVLFVVIPPSLIGDSMKAGHIQGFCVGEPWSSVAVAKGAGRIVATKRELWGMAPEKVLGVRREWAEANKQALHGLVRALWRAMLWLDEPANRWQAAETLARPDYLDVAAETIARSLTGEIIRNSGAEPQSESDFIAFTANNSAQPSMAYGLWILTQMARWGAVRSEFHFADAVAQTYRPDIFAQACGLDISAESAIDREICAATSFEPSKISSYLEDIAICADKGQLSRLARAQVARH